MHTNNPLEKLMIHWLWLLPALWVGVLLGVGVMAMMVVSNAADRSIEAACGQADHQHGGVNV